MSAWWIAYKRWLDYLAYQAELDELVRWLR